MYCLVIASESDRLAATPWKGMVELRLDLFKPRMEEFEPKRCLITLRSNAHGGEGVGSQSQRMEQLFPYLETGVAWVDLECPQDQALNQKISKEFPHIKRLVSYHNWHKTPKNLDEILEEMQVFQGHAYKIACHCTSSVDALRLWTFSQQNNAAQAALITIGLGPLGLMTRLAAPLAHCPWTYVSPQKGQETPPSWEAFKGIPTLSKGAQLLGLLGDPVTYSVSHLSHNAYMAAQGIDGLYLKLQTKTRELEDILKFLRQEPWRGCSVTMPLKEAIIPHMDTLDPLAAAIGAVNTVCVKKGRLKGFNTDAVAAVEALSSRGPLKGCTLCLVGAGGAAKAVAHALARAGAQITIYNRDVSKAENLARAVGGQAFPLAALPEAHVDIIVQATPLGMSPNSDENPIPVTILKEGQRVLELIAHPRKTRLLDEAERRGCVCIDGREFFARQAAEQFALWYGESYGNWKKMEELCSTV